MTKVKEETEMFKGLIEEVEDAVFEKILKSEDISISSVRSGKCRAYEENLFFCGVVYKIPYNKQLSTLVLIKEEGVLPDAVKDHIMYWETVSKQDQFKNRAMGILDTIARKYVSLRAENISVRDVKFENMKINLYFTVNPEKKENIFTGEMYGELKSVDGREKSKFQIQVEPYIKMLLRLYGEIYCRK